MEILQYMSDPYLKYGAPDRIRTYGTQRRRLVLYPLSYRRTFGFAAIAANPFNYSDLVSLYERVNKLSIK